MRHKIISLAAKTAVLGGLVCAVANAQFPIAENSVCPDSRYAEFHACATSVTPAPDLPRTHAGHIDFSGYWRRQAWAFESFEEHPETPDDFGGPSVVVDPPDGMVPIQPWAEEQRQFNEDNYIHHNAACFLSGPAGTMYMTSRFQFLQDESMIAMVGEQLTAHPYRVIPFDGRPHIGDIPLWNGDPRGRWEDDTLVIESPNHNAVYLLDQRGRFITDEAHIVERMTLIDPDTIHYSATFDDPLVYTQPFTIAFAFRRDRAPNPEIWEEACYETNADAMRLFRSEGKRTYPGMTGDEARRAKAAWETGRR